MRRLHLARDARRFAAIREVQKLAADGAASAARTSLQRAEAAAAAGEAALAEGERAWSERFAAGRLDPELSRAWGRELLSLHADAAQAGAEAQTARDDRDQAAREASAAQGRLDVASATARSAARAARRHADEAALTEAEDSFATRRSRR